MRLSVKRTEDYAKNENQKQREETFSRASGRYCEIGYGVQASHPDHKTTKNKRQLRGTRNINASDVTSVLRMMPSA
jgi:large subunit ribosomal protein L35